MRRGRINILSLLVSILAIGGVIWGSTFGPYYWDHQVMKEIARSAVLQWYATENQDKGRDRLTRLLAKRGIEDYIYPSDCFFETRGKLRSIRCAWQVDVFYPYSDYYETLAFETTVEVNQRGDITQW